MRPKRYQSIVLNGKHFQLDTKVKANKHSLSGRYSIYDAYNRPSSTKIELWNEWEKWFLHNGGLCTIISYNCNFFSIHGYVHDSETNKEYYCYITYANHYCYEVV